MLVSNVVFGPFGGALRSPLRVIRNDSAALLQGATVSQAVLYAPILFKNGVVG